MKTYPVNHSLLAPAADALLFLDKFSQYVALIAETMQQLTLPDHALLIQRLAEMLEQLATDAQNCEGGRLSAYLCQVLDVDSEKMH